MLIYRYGFTFLEENMHFEPVLNTNTPCSEANCTLEKTHCENGKFNELLAAKDKEAENPLESLIGTPEALYRAEAQLKNFIMKIKN